MNAWIGDSLMYSVHRTQSAEDTFEEFDPRCLVKVVMFQCCCILHGVDMWIPISDMVARLSGFSMLHMFPLISLGETVSTIR